MSDWTYNQKAKGTPDKVLVWLRGAIRTPPFTAPARLEVGYLLRCLQRGEALGMPRSRPMPAVDTGFHELRVVDAAVTWRVIYYVADDAIVILDVFSKKTRATPHRVIADCRKRLVAYRRAVQELKEKP